MKDMLLETPSSNGAVDADVDHDDFKRQLLATLGLVRDGDFSARLPSDWTGLDGKVADLINQIVSRMERSNANLFRLCRAVGEEGKLGERLALGDSVGGWAERIEAINVPGASDCLAKPVNTDQLLLLLRVWLHR